MKKFFLILTIIVCTIGANCFQATKALDSGEGCYKFTNQEGCNDGPFWDCYAGGCCTDFHTAGGEDGFTWDGTDLIFIPDHGYPATSRYFATCSISGDCFWRYAAPEDPEQSCLPGNPFLWVVNTEIVRILNYDTVPCDGIELP